MGKPRFLCPNCHAQTENFGIKNKRPRSSPEERSVYTGEANGSTPFAGTTATSSRRAGGFINRVSARLAHGLGSLPRWPTT